MKLLIADDNDSDRLLLKTLLLQQGHDVFCAENGAEAVEAYQTWHPDVVLMDALMPVMDGFQAAREIRALAGDNLVPIIFITSLTDAASLVSCLDAGGDDFVGKPYNRVILGAKIQAHARLGRLHATVQEQRDKIALHHEHLLREQEVAKAVYDNIAHTGCIEASNIKHLLSPVSIFNGDMVLVSQKPSGGIYVLLGDFTGHGLPAAIGTMPAAEIFYGMTRKGFTMEEVLREINAKLKHILPVGVFCCACMVDMSFHEKLVKVWAGGLPDLMIKRLNRGDVEFIRSKYLPLGVLADDSFVSQVDVFQLNEGDRIYLWSDGIHEAVDPEGRMFGTTEILRVVENNVDIDQLFEEIVHGVVAFTGQTEQADDHTMVEITMVSEDNFHSGNLEDHERDAAATDIAPMDCVISCELRADALRAFNPLAFITHFFREVPGLRAHSGKLYTILAELYSNALEHGLLGLSSSLKSSTSGFAQYYRKRDEALRELKEGHVIITLTCEPLETGGRLIMRLEDTGAGFDYQGSIGQSQPEHKTEGYCGRGIPLLLTMCQSVRYLGKGNIVEACFVW